MPNPDSRSEADYRRTSFWLDTVPGSLQPRAALNADTSADVAIAGAGYTGLWTAYYLKRQQPSLDIVVVDADIAGFGASGRNGGWCSCFLDGIEYWSRLPGLADDALRLQRLMFDAVDEVGRASEREGIDCHYDKSGGYEIARGGMQLARLRHQFGFYRESGLAGEAFRWLDEREAAAAMPMSHARAGIRIEHVAAIHPARLVRGLADTLERSGVRIYEHSPATHLAARRIDTPGGRIRAETVIRATEGFTRSIPGSERVLAPIHSMMVATRPLDEARLAATGLTRRFTFGDTSPVVTYGQLTADGRIAFGARGTYRYGSKIRTFTPADREFDVVRATLLRMFPDLAGVEFTHAWGGPLGMSRTLRPSVRFDPDSRTGWAGGYGGNGVAAANLGGRTLADLVLGRDTDRCRTPWVNSGDSCQWESEPWRWFGITGVRQVAAAMAGIERLLAR